MIGSDPQAQPFPRLARISMARVLAQLAWRMRWDLALMALLGGIGLGVQQIQQVQNLVLMDSSSLTTLGIAVSVFVAFRNTHAINRWWESRTLWGAIVNNSRSWRDTLGSLLVQPQQAERQRLVALQALLCWLLNFELRGRWRTDARQHADALSNALGLPPRIRLQEGLIRKAEEIGRLHQEGLINDWGRDALLRCSEVFTNALGGLQRIRNSPIPPTYDVFIRGICWFYGYAQFLNFVNRGDSWEGTVILVGFITAERVGAYVENPFDDDGKSFCVPMDSVCRTISGDLLGPHSPLTQLPISSDPSRWS
jgi:putative membrane protein